MLVHFDPCFSHSMHFEVSLLEQQFQFARICGPCWLSMIACFPKILFAWPRLKGGCFVLLHPFTRHMRRPVTSASRIAWYIESWCGCLILHHRRFSWWCPATRWVFVWKIRLAPIPMDNGLPFSLLHLLCVGIPYQTNTCESCKSSSLLSSRSAAHCSRCSASGGAFHPAWAHGNPTERHGGHRSTAWNCA